MDVIANDKSQKL